MAVNIGQLYAYDSSHWRGPMLYNYRYDQLNRITGMDAFYGLNQSGNSWSALTATQDFKERVTYDPNGNIQKYLRNNFGETGLPMDSLGYNYIANTNKLAQIRDSAADFVGGGYDLHSQPTNNYAYDSIGNMIKDSIERIPRNGIKWNVYGKITEIDHSSTTINRPTKNIYYYYDAAGNRIGKKTTRGDTSKISYTWYVRDASGNVMATYTATEDSSAALSAADLHIGEKHIYGSSRLGILNANYSTDASADGLNVYTSPWGGIVLSGITGNKQYELTNHLGNVLATISDKKIGVSLASDSSLTDHYEADVLTAQDYYPFGMIMPGRMFTALTVPGGSVTGGTTQVNGYALPVDLTLNSRTGDKPSEYVATQYIDLTEGFESGDSTDMLTAYIADTSYAGTGNGGSDADGVAGGGKYRYGFNGKEQDNEVKGVGDQIDYGKRIYDPRIGKFLSVDLLYRKYPELTPYQFAGNEPISNVDVDGLEPSLAPGGATIAPFSGLGNGLRSSYPGPGTSALNAAIVAPTGPTIGYSASGEPFIVPGQLDFSWTAREEQERHKKELYRLYGIRVKGTWELHPDAELKYRTEEQPKIFQELEDKRKERDKWAQLAINRANGRAWENVVARFIEKDPKTDRNFQQVTLDVSGELNGKPMSVRVRVDNLTFTTSGTLNIYESKFSMEQITYNNFTYTLTANQKDAYALFANGDKLSIFLATDKLEQINIPKGAIITSLIDKIQIIPNKPKKDNKNTPSKIAGSGLN
jgi:RHS repeat-associated protein